LGTRLLGKVAMLKNVPLKRRLLKFVPCRPRGSACEHSEGRLSGAEFYCGPADVPSPYYELCDAPSASPGRSPAQLAVADSVGLGRVVWPVCSVDGGRAGQDHQACQPGPEYASVPRGPPLNQRSDRRSVATGCALDPTHAVVAGGGCSQVEWDVEVVVVDRQADGAGEDIPPRFSPFRSGVCEAVQAEALVRGAGNHLPVHPSNADAHEPGGRDTAGMALLQDWHDERARLDGLCEAQEVARTEAPEVCEVGGGIFSAAVEGLQRLRAGDHAQHRPSSTALVCFGEARADDDRPIDVCDARSDSPHRNTRRVGGGSAAGCCDADISGCGAHGASPPPPSLPIACACVVF